MRVRRFVSNRLSALQRPTAALTRAEDQRGAAGGDELLSTLHRIEERLIEIRRVSEGIQYALTQEDMREVEDFYVSHVLGFEDTLRKIADDRLSFARFGDGEFRAMLNADHNLRFQVGSPELQAALKSVLTYEHYDPSQLLLGFPLPYRSPHWQKVWSDVWPRLSQLLRRDITYGVTHATRPMHFRRLGQHGVELWRRVWQDRNVCVITGKDSRFTMHPALFDNLASVEFLYSVPRDAFAHVPDLLEKAVKADRYDLFLISLGPAGTVLAAELSRAGRWAVDIGHLSASYEHVFEGAVSPEHRPI